MNKVLVAEDDVVTRKIIVHAIESLGMMAIQCSDGRRALELLADNPDVSLLITDMMMPNVGGRELIETIHKTRSGASLPIIMVSALVKLNDVMDLLEAGASYFMPKPINVSDLKHYVTSSLQHREECDNSSATL